MEHVSIANDVKVSDVITVDVPLVMVLAFKDVNKIVITSINSTMELLLIGEEALRYFLPLTKPSKVPVYVVVVVVTVENVQAFPVVKETFVPIEGSMNRTNEEVSVESVELDGLQNVVAATKVKLSVYLPATASTDAFRYVLEVPFIGNQKDVA